MDPARPGGAPAEPPLRPADALDPRAFILAHTRPARPPHAPEIVLRLAGEALPIWRSTEEALGALGVPPPFWAFAWAGGQALARYLLDHPEAVAGRRVVDLASGSGLSAIAAARLGARRVLAADPDPFAQEAIALNAAENGVEVEVTGEDLLGAPAPAWADLLLVGDAFYERPLAERVMAWLRSGRSAGASVLIGDPGRAYLPRGDLRRLAEYQVPVSRELEDQEIKRTCVYDLGP